MQRSIALSGQSGNTIWNAAASGGTWYGLFNSVFLVDAGYASPVNGAFTCGAFQQSLFSCVMSRLFQCTGALVNTASQLTTKVNVGGTSPAPGNMAAAAPNVTLTTTANYWYDATDLDAITAGQKFGSMQVQGNGSQQGPLNPSFGVIIDAPSQGFFAPFLYPSLGATKELAYLNGPYHSHLCGNSGNVMPAGFSATANYAQDYFPQAFVASGVQWQNTAAAVPTSSGGLGPGDSFNLATCSFAYGTTFGTAVGSSVSATIAPNPAGTSAMFIDTTDICAVAAGNYPCTKWTGNCTSGSEKIGNAGLTIRPAASNTMRLISGSTKNPGSATWPGTLTSPTWQMFNGAPRTDSIYTENNTAFPAAGVLSGYAFETDATAFTGGPTLAVIQIGVDLNSGAGSGVASYSSSAGGAAPANFVNSTVSVALTAASTYYFDLTDLVAVTPFNGMLQAITFNAGTDAGGTQAYSLNFTAPAHRGLLERGAG